MSRILSRRDLDFLLYEMLDVEKLFSQLRFETNVSAAITQVLDRTPGRKATQAPQTVWFWPRE